MKVQGFHNRKQTHLKAGVQTVSRREEHAFMSQPRHSAWAFVQLCSHNALTDGALECPQRCPHSSAVTRRPTRPAIWAGGNSIGAAGATGPAQRGNRFSVGLHFRGHAAS